jgi:hypothetical protein
MFVAHLVLLGWQLDWGFIRGIEEAKDISAALGLFSALFSGFAAFGLLYTVDLQRHALRLQQEDAKRSAALQIRLLHMDLLKAAIADPELKAVWADESLVPTGRQSMYVNLILSHWETLFTQDLLSEARLRNLVDEKMHRAIAASWTKNRVSRSRHAISQSSKATRFHEIIDVAYLRHAEEMNKPPAEN